MSSHALQREADRRTSLGVSFDKLSVGQCFESTAREVSEADVALLAALLDQWQVGPLDVERKGIERHAGCFRPTVSAAVALSCATAFGLTLLDPRWVVGVRRIRDVLIPVPVTPGDVIRIKAELRSLQPTDADFGIVTIRWQVSREGHTAAAAATVEFVWRRGRGSHPAAELDDDWSLAANVPV